MMERIVIAVLYCFDFIMNLITLGQWGRSRGEERVFIKVK